MNLLEEVVDQADIGFVGARQAVQGRPKPGCRILILAVLLASG
jgi:hypothetical protein